MATRDDIYTAIRNADAAGDTASVQKLAAYLQTMDAPAEAPKAAKPEPSELQKVGNLAAGAVRGAGSIGATVLAPIDYVARKLGVQNDYIGRTDRREAMTEALGSMGADTDSIQYGAGKIGAEIAGSLGAGGALANGVRLIPGAGALASSIASGGFNTGMAPGLANWAARIAGGGINGAATAGLVDPSQTGAGAVMGAALPVVAGASGAAGDAISRGMEGASKRLMQSAIKPTLKQLQSGDAETAVNTLLQKGISPDKAGVNKLRALIDDLDSQISSKIAGSSATVDKAAVVNRLADTQRQFTTQVSPTSDLSAIRGVADDFLAHPSFPLPQTGIPVQAAQDLKRGTYQVLAKKYGQMGGAETEAQKALARGLKEEIAAAVPGVQGINAELSKLITTLDVTERRALMEINKNPGGLSLLAGSPAGWAAFMADRSAAFKAIAARMLNATSGGAGNSVNLLGNAGANPLIRNALVRPAMLSNEASP